MSCYMYVDHLRILCTPCACVLTAYVSEYTPFLQGVLSHTVYNSKQRKALCINTAQRTYRGVITIHCAQRYVHAWISCYAVRTWYIPIVMHTQSNTEHALYRLQVVCENEVLAFVIVRGHGYVTYLLLFLLLYILIQNVNIYGKVHVPLCHIG